jgi:glycosyltransferase involved in cell wall biosynthesis
MAHADICVLIPTYNNAGTLAQVLEEVLLITPNVLVVNDGSTDATESVLARFPAITSVQYHPNKGKGYALRQGFKIARKQGFHYAISMDADGQHYASDLPAFFAAREQYPGSLVVGARNMDKSGQPGSSGFANRFSNFWFHLETGIACPDTQSGFRLYPIGRYSNSFWVTRKYEFEIEVLVRSAWRGIPVRAIPVGVYYPPAEERVTHFRPFKDFTRISLLNTVLVILSFLYIKPRDLLMRIFTPKSKDH